MKEERISLEQVKEVTRKLLEYCQRNDWAGYDPYDALNSGLLSSFRLLDSRVPRIILTQLMKRSPVNLRPLLRIPKTHNPKALALFLMAFVKLSKQGMLEDHQLIETMVDRLSALRAEGAGYSCWGYSFPWQTRGLLVPRGAPNIVCTVFVANALLDLYEEEGNEECLAMAVSAANYLLNELFWTEGPLSAGFAYPLPSTRIHIYNAELLGAALLCRVSHLAKDRRFIEPALKVARYSVSKQNPDGSWYYGELPIQQWIDNFHTGYNIMALKDIIEYGGAAELTSSMQLGFEFYRDHFFRSDGAPKYFHNKTYPIDIHSVAQSIITLSVFKAYDRTASSKLSSVIAWTLENMWNPRDYFNFQKHSLYTIRIPYMRWSQAWMLMALTTFLKKSMRAEAKRQSFKADA